MMDLLGRVTDYLLDVHYASISSINEVSRKLLRIELISFASDMLDPNETAW